jgi:hypothetical protein
MSTYALCEINVVETNTGDQRRGSHREASSTSRLHGTEAAGQNQTEETNASESDKLKAQEGMSQRKTEQHKTKTLPSFERFLHFSRNGSPRLVQRRK